MHEHKHAKYTFHVNGMHCKSCVLVVDSELGTLPYVAEVKTHLGSHTVEVSGDFGGRTQDDLAGALTDIVKSHGYSLTVDKKKVYKDMSDFKFAIPAAIAFLAVFFILQKAGIVNLVSASKVTYGTAFLVGIVASLSTCMAVVGGLVLSISATYSKDGDSFKPQALFHVGRLLSFFVLGGIIGQAGAFLEFNATIYFLLNLTIGVVMLIMGINLLDIFDFAKKFQLSMPGFISKHAYQVSKWNHSFTPFILGAATFFFPCGFTQAMQFYSLSLGNFWGAAMTMFSFSLGTLPILALLSYSSFNIGKSKKAGIFFKAIGIVVIFFALFNILNGLVAAGYIEPIFNF